MKTNEAPEKLYIALNEFTEDGRTFVLDHRTDYPICTEYTRTDAFIEKACEWIKEKWDDNYTMPIIIDSVIDDFKNYMKGE